MRRTNLKTALIAVTSTAALSFGLGINPAAATNPPFQINPDTGLGVTGYSTFTADQINGLSNALIQQTGATTQTETGTLQLENYSLGGALLSHNVTGLDAEAGDANSYGGYFTYSVNVSGLTGLEAPSAHGVITSGSFTFYGDVSNNDTFTPASTSATGGSAPTVTDTGGNDVVIATGAAVGGTVDTNASGTPNFTAFASFILCDGTASQGLLGSTVINGGAAAACGSFDATKYFVAPVPFYSVDVNSAIVPAGFTAGADLTGSPPNITLNGLQADVAFIQAPEPASLAMFGFGLIGLGWFARRRRKSA